MHPATKKVRAALMGKYRDPAFAVPVAMQERPRRVQYRALMREEPQFVTPTPEQPQQMGQPDLMMLGGMLGQALDLGGVPIPGQIPPMDPAMMALGGGQVPGAGPGGPGGPMMAPEQLPAQPGAAQAATRVPAQAGPGIDPSQILAALFGA